MQILLPILAVLLSTIGSMHATAAESCETWEKNLKKEQYIIVERENDLSRKVEKGQGAFEKSELDKLIKRHHSAIEAFNLKLDNFNQKCGKKRALKDKTTQTKTSGGKNPEQDVVASDELIKTLKGYFIQAAAFKRYANAAHLQTKLAKKEISSLIITRPYVYALWVGPYEDRKAAKAAKASLRTDYKIKGYIIRFR